MRRVDFFAVFRDDDFVCARCLLSFPVFDLFGVTAFAVLVPTYNRVVFFRFFKDAPYIVEIFILFGDIAADKSVSRAAGFPHRAIKVVGPSLFVIIFHRFSGDDDFVVIRGEDFSYVVGFIGVRCFGLSNSVFCFVLSVGPLPPVNKVNLSFND